MSVTIGIDPGATGAIAILDSYGELIEVHDMPYADKHVLAPVLAELLDGWTSIADVGLTTAWVEQVASMPRQGVASTFRFGVSYGAVLGVLGALAIPTRHVTPAVWKRSIGVTKDKGTSRRVAIERWPAHASSFARVKDDGRAEAALIAHYGHNQQETK